MAKAKHSCPNCGDPVIAARWDAGYHYCKKRECFAALGRRPGVPLHETPPDPSLVDIDVYDLEDVASLYGEGD